MQNIYENYYWQDDKIRLRLRESQDAEFNFQIEMDSECIRFVGEEIALPPVKKRIDPNGDSAEPNSQAPAFTIETLDGDFVGGIHFNYINERHGAFSIGLAILKSQRRKGFGKAAMRMLFEYAFNERRLNKFSGFCLDDNIASSKMMLSLGCKQEGIVREEVFLNGKYHDRLLFGMTASEYNDKYTK